MLLQIELFSNHYQILQEKNAKTKIFLKKLAKQQFYNEGLQFWVGYILCPQILHFRNCCNEMGDESYCLNNSH